jgi:hypothetical protein
MKKILSRELVSQVQAQESGDDEVDNIESSAVKTAQAAIINAAGKGIR